jgi:hypothetical protein
LIVLFQEIGRKEIGEVRLRLFAGPGTSDEMPALVSTFVASK